MRHSSRTIVALIILVIFVASLGVSGVSSKRLAHELDHDGGAAMSVVDHDHAPPLITDGSTGPEPLSDIEHRLLHAANHLQPLPSSTIEFSWEPPAHMMPLSSSLPVLPAAELEPPFRPPRNTALI